jgi:azurin
MSVLDLRAANAAKRAARAAGHTPAPKAPFVARVTNWVVTKTTDTAAIIEDGSIRAASDYLDSRESLAAKRVADGVRWS